MSKEIEKQRNGQNEQRPVFGPCVSARLTKVHTDIHTYRIT